MFQFASRDVLAISGAVAVVVVGTLWYRSKAPKKARRESDDGLSYLRNFIRMRRVWYEAWRCCGGKWPENGFFQVEGSNASASKLMKLYRTTANVSDEELEKALEFQNIPNPKPKTSFTPEDHSTAFKRCLAMNPCLLDASVLMRDDLSVEAVIADLAFKMTPVGRQMFRLLLRVCVLVLDQEEPIHQNQLALRQQKRSGARLSMAEETLCQRRSLNSAGVAVCVTPRLFRDDPVMQNLPAEKTFARVIKCQRKFDEIIRFARFHAPEMDKLLLLREDTTLEEEEY